MVPGQTEVWFINLSKKNNIAAVLFSCRDGIVDEQRREESVKKAEAVRHERNGIFQMQGGKNRILPK